MDIEIMKIVEPLDNVGEDECIKMNSERYVCGYNIFKLQKKYSCQKCDNDFLKPGDEILSLKTEHFIFHTNLGTNSDLYNLKVPSDNFFNVTKIHINIFDQYFGKNFYEKNIKSNIKTLCIKKTTETVEFKEWFSKNGACYQHRLYFLDSLLLLLLKKNAIWLKQKLIKEHFQLKYKKKN